MRFLLKSAITMIQQPGESISNIRVRNDWQINRPALASGLVLAAAFFFCYATVFRFMVSQWWNNDMYSYGFLIPVISLYLIWARRERLKRVESLPDLLGGITVLVAGFSLLILGHAAKVLLIQELSLIVTLVGTVLLVLGRGYLRVLLFPISYLLFMIPIWDFITDRLHLPFQLFSSTIGLTLMQTIGLPAYRQGVFIELPNVTLEVAKACSGVNYLIAVIAIGIPIAYLSIKGWIRRTVLVGMAVTVAILANGIRVALIGTLSYYGLSGEGDIHGPLHILQGMFVSVIGYAAIFGGVWALSPTPLSRSNGENRENSEAVLRSVSDRRTVSIVAVSLAAALLLTGSYLHFYQPIGVPLKKELKYFPHEIGEWRGTEAAPNPNLLASLEATQTLSRVYRNVSGDEVHLYIGYFDLQDQGKKLVSYKTDRLFRGGSEGEINLNNQKVHVNQNILQEADRRTLVLFWYELNGKIVTDQYRAKLYTMWDTLVHRRSNGAIVLLSINLPPTDDINRTLPAINQLGSEVYPDLTHYLPKD